MNIEAFGGLEPRQIDGSAEVERVLPLFAKNMIAIGTLVSRQGIQHPGYPLNMIHILDSAPVTEGFDAEVYLEPQDDPQIVLNGHNIPQADGYRRNYLEISYRPDTRVSLRLRDLTRYPQAVGFERPQSPLPPGNLFSDHGDSLFLWMKAEFLGQNIVEFLNEVTTKGLGDLQTAVNSRKVSTLIDISNPRWRTEVLPEYLNLREDLEIRYNTGNINYRNGIRNETVGGHSFAMTLGVTMNKTKDAEAVRSIYEALSAIIDKRASGDTAWEMRRFIRRAPTAAITEFGNLIRQLAEVSPDMVYLDMDFFYWDTEWVEGANNEQDRAILAQDILKGLKHRIDRAKGHS